MSFEIVAVRDPSQDPLGVQVLVAAERWLADRGGDPAGILRHGIAADLTAAWRAGGTVLAAREGTGWVAVAALTRRAWDSDHFAADVYRVGGFAHDFAATGAATAVARAITGAARAAGASFVHAWVPLDDIPGARALEGEGFRLADVLTTFGMDLTASDPSTHEHRCVTQASEADGERLASLARESFRRTPDRFHRDPRLSPSAADGVYAKWIANSCRGEAADVVLMAEDDGQPLGFVTVAVDAAPIIDGAASTAGIPLVAVSRHAEGRGVASALLAAALCWMKERNVEYGHIGTQANNYPMQRLLPRLGMRLIRSGASMHLWTEPA